MTLTPECNGICIDASELIEGFSGIAYPHPDCELHSPDTALCCTAPECCGPGSYCCAHAGPHTHPEEQDTQ